MNRKPLETNKFTGWEVGSDYRLIKMLGQGAYGAVASAVHLPTGKKVAIKRMEGLFEDETDSKRILREIHILKQLKSPSVVGLFDMIPPSNTEKFDTIYVVLQLSESDLKKVIKSAIYLEAKHIKTVVYNLLCGLKYLHTANIIHRDLKPANVLINEDCSVQIADFGLSRSLKGVHTQSMTLTKRNQQELDNEHKTNTEQTYDRQISDQRIFGAEPAPIEKNDSSPMSLNEAKKIEE